MLHPPKDYETGPLSERSRHDFEDYRRNAKSDRKLREQRPGDGHQQNQQNGEMSVGEHL
jgi:hypothetical protein